MYLGIHWSINNIYLQCLWCHILTIIYLKYIYIVGAVQGDISTCMPVWGKNLLYSQVVLNSISMYRTWTNSLWVELNFINRSHAEIHLVYVCTRVYVFAYVCIYTDICKKTKKVKFLSESYRVIRLVSHFPWCPHLDRTLVQHKIIHFFYGSGLEQCKMKSCNYNTRSIQELKPQCIDNTGIETTIIQLWVQQSSQ